jgi:hypothetical protein
LGFILGWPIDVIGFAALLCSDGRLVLLNYPPHRKRMDIEKTSINTIIHKDKMHIPCHRIENHQLA